MRLRYLHLPRCGPLTDTAIVFGREDRITRALDLQRKGSLNFLVGVNGSGKSSLLRALYHIFRSLNLRERPVLPVKLAWDRRAGDETVTALLHYTNQKDSNSFFATLKQAPATTKGRDWKAITSTLSQGEQHPLLEGIEIATGPETFTNSLLFAMLPKRIIVYTSGKDDLWVPIDHRSFHPKDEEEGQYQTEDERPHGWSIDREWGQEQPIRMTDVLSRHVLKSSGVTRTLQGAGLVGELTSESLERLFLQLEQQEAIRRKVLMNRKPRSEQLDDFYFRVLPRQLRLTGIVLALWQTAKELSGLTEEHQREALRNFLLHQQDSESKPNDARCVLNEIDWFWPTHLSLTYHDADNGVSPRQYQELLCLVALADEVIAQPLGRRRAVFSLGPSDRISLTEKLKEAFPLSIPSKGIEFIANRVDGCKTGAEAILRVLSADLDIDSTPMDVFSRFRDWERTGLLEELTLTVKRFHRSESADGEQDDIIVTYDQLSDGEQMLLGRMGLLFLLRGQDGSLLLLDEPETHFNDVWKREIVEMADMALLNSTEANIVISTHTSIALTDAFAAEVTVLDKNKGAITARSVTGGLFGTDPGEVTMNLFGAESSIGSRSLNLLERLLDTEWKGREDELEAILNVLGSSFHRAELRAILKQLRAKNDDSASG